MLLNLGTYILCTWATTFLTTLQQESGADNPQTQTPYSSVRAPCFLLCLHHPHSIKNDPGGGPYKSLLQLLLRLEHIPPHEFGPQGCTFWPPSPPESISCHSSQTHFAPAPSASSAAQKGRLVWSDSRPCMCTVVTALQSRFLLTTQPVLFHLGTATTEPVRHNYGSQCPRACALQQEKPLQSAACAWQLDSCLCISEDQAQPKMNN